MKNLAFQLKDTNNKKTCLWNIRSNRLENRAETITLVEGLK